MLLLAILFTMFKKNWSLPLPYLRPMLALKEKILLIISTQNIKTSNHADYMQKVNSYCGTKLKFLMPTLKTIK